MSVHYAIHAPYTWGDHEPLIIEREPCMDTAAKRRIRTLTAIIDAMLAHRPKGASGSEMAYNRAAYMPRRREIAQDWADLVGVNLIRDPQGILLAEGFDGLVQTRGEGADYDVPDLIAEIQAELQELKREAVNHVSNDHLAKQTLQL